MILNRHAIFSLNQGYSAQVARHVVRNISQGNSELVNSEGVPFLHSQHVVTKAGEFGCFRPKRARKQELNQEEKANPSKMLCRKMNEREDELENFKTYQVRKQ